MELFVSFDLKESVVDFGEFLECDEKGFVIGVDTGRVVAKFSHVQEGESFVQSYNQQEFSDTEFDAGN